MPKTTNHPGHPTYVGTAGWLAYEAGIAPSLALEFLVALDLIGDHPSYPAFSEAMRRLAEHPDLLEQAYAEYLAAKTPC